MVLVRHSQVVSEFFGRHFLVDEVRLLPLLLEYWLVFLEDSLTELIGLHPLLLVVVLFAILLVTTMVQQLAFVGSSACS